MKQLPTAEELLNEILSSLKIERESLDNDPELKPYLLEQINNRTKLHVKAALEAAAKNSKIKVSLNKSAWNPENWYDEYFIDKESILNAYLENLIK